MARAAELRLGKFNARNLANMAWAFAKTVQPDATLLAALARAAQRCVGHFTSQELANRAWAFVTHCAGGLRDN